METKVLKLCAFLFLCLNASHAGESPPHKLNVNGYATLYKPADKFTLKLGVVSFDSNADVAAKVNREKMQAIFAALKDMGLSDREMQTARYVVVPKYTPTPRDPSPNWEPTIKGYEVRNMLSIQTNQLEIAGQLIDAAAKQGANIFEDISFSLQEPEDAQTEAITHAVQQGRTYAEAAANAAKITLGEILELTLNPTAVTPRSMNAVKFSSLAQGNETPISTGDVEITASVSVVFEIKP